jgi:hypothetical protein
MVTTLPPSRAGQENRVALDVVHQTRSAIPGEVYEQARPLTEAADLDTLPDSNDDT